MISGGCLIKLGNGGSLSEGAVSSRAHHDGMGKTEAGRRPREPTTQRPHVARGRREAAQGSQDSALSWR